MNFRHHRMWCVRILFLQCILDQDKDHQGGSEQSSSCYDLDSNTNNRLEHSLFLFQQNFALSKMVLKLNQEIKSSLYSIPFRVSRVSGAHLRCFAPAARTHKQGYSGGESLVTCGRFDRLRIWIPCLSHQMRTTCAIWPIPLAPIPLAPSGRWYLIDLSYSKIWSLIINLEQNLIPNQRNFMTTYLQNG